MKIKEEINRLPFKNETQKAALNILFTSNWISSQYQKFFNPYGITSQQYHVLSVLRITHPKTISTSEIKARLHDRNSDASRIVDRLTSKGYVKKSVCSEDRRLVDVSLTENGFQLLHEVDRNIDIMNDFSGNLNEREAQTLNELLDKLRSAC
ncbi:MarR family transcriptional regulator [Fulvivirga sp. M361]|uniref:MarR family winged helix-turn-helix transcriptional regulator n=1 Tax=Fulvivirga sp. M361 TaxID=2594266 RepID=UPI001179C560|nr:MarR family transcriptional regulator [Fulvivirga sp. M361]TRX56111.1 MarR family transcriptional regulator [Fulvivirga sp. M361]